MKKIIISGLILGSLLASSVTAPAWISSKITNSGHWTSKTSYGGICAYGYTDSDTYHYTSTKLFCNNGQVRQSDREWGTGSVSASTGTLEYNSNYHYGSAVYYGFDD